MKKRYIGASVALVVIAVIIAFFYSLMKEKSFHLGSSNNQEGFYEYYHGNYSEAFKKLLPQAKDGIAAAQVNLGNLYRSGLGVEQNNKHAVYWYNEACKQDNSDAIVNLAIMYKFGIYLKKNIEKSIELLKRAIKINNDASAKFNLAMIYLDSTNTFFDLKKGLELLTESAKQGNSSAQTLLGASYYIGKYDLPIDYQKANSLLLKSSLQGDPIGQNDFAVLHYEGKAKPKDDFEAYKWFYISAEFGQYPKAIDNIKKLNFKLTDTSKHNAEKQAKKWVKQHNEINYRLTMD